MTRINLIPPEELHYKHLVAEYREITRVPTLARRAQREMHKKSIPPSYTMGVGHVLHFYNKLGFIADRYESLCDEMRRRGYVCNQIPRSELLKDIDSRLVRAYNPTPEAVELNRQRIAERMPK
mgnify:CR=1 FL=1